MSPMMKNILFRALVRAFFDYLIFLSVCLDLFLYLKTYAPLKRIGVAGPEGVRPGESLLYSLLMSHVDSSYGCI